MNARELAETILRDIEEGTLDPDAVVVRPFCLCDEECGLIEARHVDQVVRRYESVPAPPPPIELDGDPVATRIFKRGSVEPGPSTAKTVKLG
jgi:hypothetical protein